MEKDFDTWNKEKKLLNNRKLDYNFFYHPQEIWWCSIGLNIGIETDGKHDNFERPILVVRKFNKEQFWGIPLTKNEHSGEFYHKVNHKNGVSWVILSQLKAFSAKRLLRKIGKISEKEFESVQNKLKDLI